MNSRYSRLLPSLFLIGGAALAQDPAVQVPTIVARISTSPLLSREEVARLEAKVNADPQDVATRLTLLNYYNEMGAFGQADNPVRRNARLQHILYLIDHQGDRAVESVDVPHVWRSGGPYANEGDHEMARSHWQSAAAARQDDSRILLRAVRFLSAEDKAEAERMLLEALARKPDNNALGANLGFLYAVEVLGLQSMEQGSPRIVDEDLARHARQELERTTNPMVLAGAATAIPNLSIRIIAGSDTTPFDYAASLMKRARELAPQDPELQGPMPMIQYFEVATRRRSMPQPPPTPELPATTPGRIRVGSAVQAAKLLEHPDPVYPELARQAKLRGVVRLNAVVGKDGRVIDLQLISGHPLLVPPALDAAKQWRYQPTLLNGSPVEVLTTIDVNFSYQP